jgi:hypothetical protein
MAEEQDNMPQGTGTSSQDATAFVSGMIKDVDDTYIPEGSWAHARNATKVTANGSLNTLSNEPSTSLCIQNTVTNQQFTDYTIIGAIHVVEDKWVIFSTNNTNSEIGFYDDSECSYTTMTQEPCVIAPCVAPDTLIGNTNPLGFNTKHLITGASKENFDCTWSTYFSDGINPDRFIKFDVDTRQIVPDQFVICRNIDNSGCITDTPTCKLNIDAIRIASLVSSPCVTVSASLNSGSLLNGSYFVVIAYTINQQRVTDYFPPSNVQGLFDHLNVAGSIDIQFSNLDTNRFDEFELVVVRTFNQQTSAKKLGIYSTQTTSLTVDNINEALPSVPIEQIPIRTSVVEKSDAIYTIGNYLVRSGPTSRFDFNYQPLANRIQTKWQSVEYDTDYYVKGGNNTGYMRDEVYSFFIRWIYDTGDRSSSFHIPGRAPRNFNATSTLFVPETAPPPAIAFPTAPGIIQPAGAENVFEVYNTATTTTTWPPAPLPGANILPDGGSLIAEGDMGYWESTEKYPDNNRDVWNLSSWSSVANPWPDSNTTQYDLCGLPIRHHKMPDNLLGVNNPPNPPNPQDLNAQILNATNNKIRILGVRFSNIALPRDNDGNLIQGVVGYEILRGSREGNKTVIAKGLINNMRQYPNPLDPTISNNNPIGNDPFLYQNYPYNYRGLDDTLCVSEQPGGFNSGVNTPLGLSYYSQNEFTFHSPDTQFKHPFLAVNELKLYGATPANIRGNFNTVDGHPKEKLLTDFAFIIAAMVGIVEAIIAIQGTRRMKSPTLAQSPVSSAGVRATALGWQINAVSGTTVPGASQSYPLGVPLYDNSAVIGTVDAGATAAAGTFITTNATYNTTWNSTLLVAIPSGAYGPGTIWSGFDGTGTTQAAILGSQVIPSVMEGDLGKTDYLPQALAAVTGFALFSQYWVNGTDTALRLIYALIPYEQYSASYTSHGLYGQPTGIGYNGQRRRYNITEGTYLGNSRQFFANTEVNNLYRSTCVALQTQQAVFDPATGVPDNSVQVIGSAQSTINSNITYNNITPEFPTTSDSHYAGIIQRIKNQYGQLDSIQQINISCPYPIVSTLGDSQFTGTIFGGDIYINRYTEKNTFFYFYNWLQDQPDGYEYNYRNYYMITYPRYWADFTRFEVGDFLNGLSNVLFNPGGFSTILPNDKAHLDRVPDIPFTLQSIISTITSLFTPSFRIKPGYFYLFQSGVRDFYCESEVNIAFRDWGDLPEQRFYDPNNYTSLPDLFAPDIIKSGNYYKYDYSLSISKLYFNFISWGNVQARNYNPYVANTCYTYNSNRLMYSLPDNMENTKDFWRVWLPNNYKDFYSQVTGIKSYNANGAIIVFKNDSPTLWKGVDELQTNIGTKITIGDGGLFAQPEQSLINTDISLEYGSCQDYLSILNTPFGLYYVSAEQGKIFHVTNRLDDITYAGLKFWFKEYLPYQLLQDFPTFDITGNPVAGIGSQAIYDNQIEIIYFTKKDYKLRYGWNLPSTDPNFLGTVAYIGNGIFNITPAGGATFPIDVTVVGYPTAYFQDASWTVSYDPKSEKGGWISFHDWHPDLCLPSRKHFLTVTNRATSVSANGQGTIWRHNLRRDDFTNFYGTYYPFEVEYIASTKLSVNTLRSVEYYMECYKYKGGRLDRFHLLNWNFDRAVVYNTEQVSGELTLNLAAPNDPFGNLGFPNLNLAVPTWNILYNKVEQKYRFDQFWDITNDRGEFTPSEQEIWITDPNGYTRVLNINNLDYNKAQTQRKKFRHYTNKVILTKLPPAPGGTNPINMTVKVAIDKNLLSMR